jgi:protein-L-isoaspartate(D-aspartate) O-methyltransferase
MERETMVREQVEQRGVSDPRVLAAVRAVRRHRFVPVEVADHAYEDRPLPIGRGQTISQPYIVAVMTELLGVGPGDRVLEVGTGSGYQAAVLAELGADVWSLEIVAELADSARVRLAREGYGRVHVVTGDGYAGLPEQAPFAAILVTAAPPSVPEALVEQLAEGGRMVLPVGEETQELRVLTKTPEGVRVERKFPVRFVPMVHREGERSR